MPVFDSVITSVNDLINYLVIIYNIGYSAFSDVFNYITEANTQIRAFFNFANFPVELVNVLSLAASVLFVNRISKI